MDDQQAREAAAKALHDAQWEHSRYHPEWDSLGHGRSGNDHIVEAQAHANAAIDAYLAALPVASRSDIPEQPTQAHEEGDPTEWSEARAEDWRRIRIEGGKALHKALRACGIDARFAMSGPGELADVIDLLIKSDWFAERRAAALVSSPSEQSAAPKETVIPAREAILRETIIREVLDWIEQGSSADGHQFDVADQAREHFGVSS